MTVTVSPHANDAEAFALAIKEYRDATSKWPSARSPDARVSALGNKLHNTRYATRRGSVRKQVKEALDLHLPGWMTDTAMNWEQTLQEASLFIDTSGRRPRDSSNDPTEKWLGRWLKDQRTGRNVTVEREAQLDKIIPDWRSGLPRGAPSTTEPGNQWHTKASRIAQLVERNKRMPRHSLEDEADLAGWLYTQRMHLNADTLTQDKIQWLDQAIPGWRGIDREAIWKAKAEKFIEFVARTGECPKRRSSGPAGRAEEVLKNWFDETRRQHRNGVLPDARAEYLDQHGPAWWKDHMPRPQHSLEKVEGSTNA